MSHTNFDTVWRSVKVERPKFSKKLLNAFKGKEKELYLRA